MNCPLPIFYKDIISEITIRGNVEKVGSKVGPAWRVLHDDKKYIDKDPYQILIKMISY